MHTLITRREAAERGLKHFYTGKPCKRGHDSPRFTTTGGCVKCGAFYTREYTKRYTKEAAANALGAFRYVLHPDDHAAALAYCQALDMQRGRMPQAPTQAAQPEPFDAHAARQAIFGKVLPPPTEPYLPKP